MDKDKRMDRLKEKDEVDVSRELAMSVGVLVVFVVMMGAFLVGMGEHATIHPGIMMRHW